MTTKHAFAPDYAVPPGETLKELLETKEMSQADFALRMGLTEKTVSQIINGAAPISYETASKLELVLGAPAHFWNTREAQYRETLVREEEATRLQSELDWLKTLPIAELITRGALQRTDDKTALIRSTLAFFGVSSVEAWKSVWLSPQVQFRGADAQQKRPGYVAAWLRLGEIAGQAVACKPYNAVEFRKALDAIRPLTMQPAAVWQPRLSSICAEVGVAVAIVKEIPSAGVSGITKWLSKDKALILLSLKYKTDDQFWFTFFHEACHVLKHGKKLVFYEEGYRDDNPLEKEANEFSGNLLIPPQYATKLRMLSGSAAIKHFAQSIGTSPGIVVGRMQHDGIIPPSYYHELKRKYVWGAPTGQQQQ
jgi:HTH-type transcriptional regulator / antitoxin HigA